MPNTRLNSNRVPVISQNGKGNYGFTFIEIILSLVLLSIVTSIFGMGLVAAMESYAFSRANSDMVQKAQLTLERMGRELSELTTIKIDDDITLSDHDISYNRYEGDTSAVIKTIRLHFSNNTILLEENDIAFILLDDVSNLSLKFYNGSQEITENLKGNVANFSIIMIHIDLMRPDKSTKTESFERLVNLRNNRNQSSSGVDIN